MCLLDVPVAELHRGSLRLLKLESRNGWFPSSKMPPQGLVIEAYVILNAPSPLC